MPTKGTIETNIKVPYGMYAMTFENVEIEDNFDTKQSIVISPSNSSDLRRQVIRTPIQSISTPYGVYLLINTPENISIDTGFDTEFKTTLNDNEEFNTERVVINTIRDDFETERNVLNSINDLTFDTELRTNKTINTTFDTSVLVSDLIQIQENFDIKSTVLKSILSETDLNRSVLKNVDTSFDTSRTITDIVQIIESFDTKQSILKNINTFFNTERIVKNNDKPDPVRVIAAKYIRTVVFAKSSNINFRGNTGISHEYHLASIDLIKSMLERHFIIYEKLADGSGEIQLNLENYNKNLGGEIIYEDQSASFDIIPNFELQVAKQYARELEEHLRRKGLEIKRQQDEISGS